MDHIGKNYLVQMKNMITVSLMHRADSDQCNAVSKKTNQTER